jgi:hypothetical protein
MGADEVRYVIWALIGLFGLAAWWEQRHGAGYPPLRNSRDAKLQSLAWRQGELQSFARRRGLSYVSEHASWARRWHGPPFTGRVYHFPTARNVITGRDGRGRPLAVFDYEYVRGRITTRMTVCVLRLPSAVRVPSTAWDEFRQHVPPLHVRSVGDDVVCWSESLLYPEQIIRAVTLLGAAIDGLPSPSWPLTDAPPPVDTASSDPPTPAEHASGEWRQPA